MSLFQNNRLETMSAKKSFLFLLAGALILEEGLGGGRFIFLLVLGWLLIRPPKEAFGAAFLGGLLLDLFSNAPFGAHPASFLLFALLGFLVFKRGALVSALFLFLPLVFFLAGFYQSVIDLFWLRKVKIVFDLNQAVLNTALALLLTKVLFWLKERVILEESIQLKFGL